MSHNLIVWDGWRASLTQWTWFEQAPGVGDGQGSLACCSPWDCKQLNTLKDRTELNFDSNIHKLWISLNLFYFDCISFLDLMFFITFGKFLIVTSSSILPISFLFFCDSQYIFADNLDYLSQVLEAHNFSSLFSFQFFRFYNINWLVSTFPNSFFWL